MQLVNGGDEPAQHFIHFTSRMPVFAWSESVCLSTASGPVASPSLGVHVLMLSVLAGAGMVVDWEQETGLLMTSGDVRVVRIWDTDREMKVQVLNTPALYFSQWSTAGRFEKQKKNPQVVAPAAKSWTESGSFNAAGCRILSLRWRENTLKRQCLKVYKRMHQLSEILWLQTFAPMWRHNDVKQTRQGHPSVLPFYCDNVFGFVFKVEVGGTVAHQIFDIKPSVVKVCYWSRSVR